MMASAAGQFHPGGMPGHAMPHGAHPGMGPGHPGGPGAAQQMHAMGGGPQGGQGGPMMGMGQGGGPPNAHALSHLNPGANPQMFQQQQQMQAAMANNPQFIAQQQMARVRQQQMMLQQQQAAQQGGGMMANRPGMPMGMQGGVQAVNLPPHMQQQLQNQQAQQAAQQQFLQQQQAAAIHQQQQQQQQMALALQQQQAAQHQQQQHAQQQQQAQQAQQQAQQQQAGGQQGPNAGQPNQQQQMRPPSAIQNHPQGQQAAAAAQQQAQQQAAQQAAQQAQQQAAQQGQPQQGPQGQQTPQQTQGPPGENQAAMAQQGGPQQQGQQGMPGQHGPQGQMQGDMNQQMQQQRAQQLAQMQAAQQQAAMSNMMRQAQMSGNQLKGNSVLKLLNFADHLSQFSLRQPGNQQSNDMKHWQTFVERFFSPTGVLRQNLVHSTDNGGKTFELTTGALPRYFWTHFQHGVEQIQMMMENAHEKDLPNGGHFVECPKASFIHWYKDGHQVMSIGPLKAQFNQQGKIDVLEHLANEHHEYVLHSKLQPPPDSPELTKSPNMTKNKKKQSIAKTSEPLVPIPKQVVNEWGVSASLFQFIELAETFSHMEHLFAFYSRNATLTPPEALRQLVSQWSNAQAAAQNANMQNPDGTPTSSLNPAFANNPAAMAAHRAAMSQANAGFNPAMMGHAFPGGPGPHMGMPGAANTASPAQMGMSPGMQPGQNPMGGGPPQAAGVAMVAQASQQGSTGSQGASANTSPHVANKKRRASQVKMEGADEPEGVNGVKVKASPRVGGKRQKP